MNTLTNTYADKTCQKHKNWYSRKSTMAMVCVMICQMSWFADRTDEHYGQMNIEYCEKEGRARERAKVRKKGWNIFHLLKRLVQKFHKKPPWRNSDLVRLQTNQCNTRNDQHLTHSVDFFFHNLIHYFLLSLWFLFFSGSVGPNEKTQTNEQRPIVIFIILSRSFSISIDDLTIHGQMNRTKVEAIIMFLIRKYLCKSSWMESHIK